MPKKYEITNPNGMEATFSINAGGQSRQYTLKAEDSKSLWGRNRQWPNITITNAEGETAKFQTKYFTWGNLRNPGLSVLLR